MADITMCSNEDCPLQDRCYRWTAPTTTGWQSMAYFHYTTKNDKTTCEYFYER